MLWIMSLAGPTLIAVDQINSIVSEANIPASPEGYGGQDSIAVNRAQSIVQTLAGGLMDLHDVKRRAMTVVSCLEVTWPILEAKTVAAAADRFQELPALSPIGSAAIVENLIGGRLAKAYRVLALRPPVSDLAVQARGDGERDRIAAPRHPHSLSGTSSAVHGRGRGCRVLFAGRVHRLAVDASAHESRVGLPA